MSIVERPLTRPMDDHPTSCSSSIEDYFSPATFAALVLPFLDDSSASALRASSPYGRRATSDDAYFWRKLCDCWGEPCTKDAFPSICDTYLRLSATTARLRNTVTPLQNPEDESTDVLLEMLSRCTKDAEFALRAMALIPKVNYDAERFSIARKSVDGYISDDDARSKARSGKRISDDDDAATVLGAHELCVAVNDIIDYVTRIGRQKKRSDVQIAVNVCLVNLTWLARDCYLKLFRKPVLGGNIFRDTIDAITWRCKPCFEGFREEDLGYYVNDHPYPEYKQKFGLEDLAEWGATVYSTAQEYCHILTAYVYANNTMDKRTKKKAGRERLMPPRVGYGPYAHAGRPTADIERKSVATRGASTVAALDGTWSGVWSENPLFGRDRIEVQVQWNHLDKISTAPFHLHITIPLGYRPLKLTMEQTEDPPWHRDGYYSRVTELQGASWAENGETRHITAWFTDGLGEANLKGIVYEYLPGGFPRILLRGRYRGHQSFVLTFFGSISPVGVSGFVCTYESPAPTHLFSMWGSESSSALKRN